MTRYDVTVTFKGEPIWHSTETLDAALGLQKKYKAVAATARRAGVNVPDDPGSDYAVDLVAAH
jgi:hypothetical protein